MTTVQAKAISLQRDYQCAIAILRCFGQRTALLQIGESKNNFDYQDSYYNIRHHILGFKDFLKSANKEEEELKNIIAGNESLQKSLTISTTMKKIEDFSSLVAGEVQKFDTYLTVKCSHYYVQEKEQVTTWEEDINIFNQQKSYLKKELLKSMNYLNNDIQLLNDILQCFKTQLEVNSGTQYYKFTSRRYIAEACTSTLSSLTICKNTLARKMRNQGKRLSDADMKELERIHEFQEKELEKAYKIYEKIL